MTCVPNINKLLGDAALTKLLSVSTADFCEKGVKVLNFIKTKHRSRVHPEADLVLAVTNLKPRIYLLLNQK